MFKLNYILTHTHIIEVCSSTLWEECHMKFFKYRLQNIYSICVL